MASQDLHSDIKTEIALLFALIDSTTQREGLIIDTQNYESIEFIWVSGEVIDGNYATPFEHGDESDMSDAVVVDPQWMIGDTTYVLTNAETNSTNRYGYVGKKRYVRCFINPSSITNGGYMGFIVVKSNPRRAPVAEEHSS